LTAARKDAMFGSGLHLRIPAEWDAIKAVWEPCRSALGRNGLDGDEAYALAMVAQELLENAVKYGAPGAGPVQLSIQVGPDEVTVEVKSRVGVDDAHLRRFDATIQWIRGFQDPFEAYVERMKRVFARSLANGESGLGLARIAYEGRCAIDFYVDDTSTLAVSAVYRRAGKGEWAANP
jgi:hypothetical protein